VVVNLVDVRALSKTNTPTLSDLHVACAYHYLNSSFPSPASGRAAAKISQSVARLVTPFAIPFRHRHERHTQRAIHGHRRGIGHRQLASGSIHSKHAQLMRVVAPNVANKRMCQ
jgi:hypothetical protein